MLDPKNIKELQNLLEYHVIAGAAVHKADLKFTQKVKTLEGKELFVVKDHRGDVLVDNAKVTTADVDASNGVVHIIDNVLIPRALDQSASPAVTKNIVELAAATADLSTLVTALKAGKLTDALSGKGPFTVFAPSNEAFAKLPKSVLERLLDPKNIKELQDLLEYHVIAGAAVHKADLKFTQRVKQARHWGCDEPAWLAGLPKYDEPACPYIEIYGKIRQNHIFQNFDIFGRG